jgi:fructose-bisphosphate aldolase class II
MLLNMKELLSVAKKNGFAVPAFNVSNTMLLIGVMEASEEASSPVILAIHPDELDFVRPSFIKAALHEAHHASVPVCIHLDHGSNMTQIMHAIQCGFTSVMMDASLEPLEENIAKTKQVVEIAHTVNVSVEGELGTIGSVGPDAEAGADEIIYVNPDDVEKFVDATGVDTLAVAIGTSHGLYPKDKEPELRIDLLREITARVDIPLVLHGGSGNPDEEIAEAVTLGISKINISSDTKSAFYKKAREFLANPDRYEPLTFYPACIDAMKSVAHHKINLFNAKGKASLY